MSNADKYYYSLESEEGLICMRCSVSLEKRPATFSYMGNSFPVELPSCPSCGFVFVPEELALGKVLSVEKALEDK
jgi:hypothetical protein